jgi:folate-dependent phosphoribosylglycinamide formyltransferase PurN
MSRVVLLAGAGESTNMVAHALAAVYPDLVLVQEQSVSRRQLMERRAKRLGIRAVAGQVAFAVSIVPALRAVSKRRRAAILAEFQLHEAPFGGRTIHVDSVNSDAARGQLVALQPQLIVVNGTRIIGKPTLEAVNARFINMHAGITPKYRGVHGGYWALRNGKPEEVGTTIHFVDTGIDTGSIIEQVTFQVSHDDNFSTYPLLHTAHGLPALLRATARYLDSPAPDKLRVNAPPAPPEQVSARTASAGTAPTGQSTLRHHPTALDYLRGRVFDKIR